MKKEKLVKITLSFVVGEEVSNEIVDQVGHVLNAHKHKVLNFKVNELMEEESNKLWEEID